MGTFTNAACLSYAVEAVPGDYRVAGAGVKVEADADSDAFYVRLHTFVRWLAQDVSCDQIALCPDRLHQCRHDWQEPQIDDAGHHALFRIEAFQILVGL